MNFPALKEQDDRRIMEKKPEIIPMNQQFKFKKLEVDRRVENLSCGAEAGKMISWPQKTKADPTIKLSHRQNQINYLKKEEQVVNS